MRVTGLLLMVACSASGEATASATSTGSDDVPVTRATPTTSTVTTVSTGTTDSTTTSPPADATTTSVSTTAGAEVDMGDLVGWEAVSIRVGERRLLVALANDPQKRAQGLIAVDHLGDLDGMLFEFPREALSGFWMGGTLIPLDIAFFAEDGTLVDTLTMVPCPADPCPSYVPNAPFSWALETPAGTLGPLASGALLSFDG